MHKMNVTLWLRIINIFQSAHAKRVTTAYKWSFSYLMLVWPSVLLFQKQSAVISRWSAEVPFLCMTVVTIMYLKFLLLLSNYLTDSSLVCEIYEGTTLWLYSLFANIFLQMLCTMVSLSCLMCPNTTLS